jgi:isopenicillin N synthase-like dioxygenase
MVTPVMVISLSYADGATREGHDLIPYSPPLAVAEIPMVDFGAAGSPDIGARRALAREIGKACRDVGFFYIVNHGVDERLLEAQLDWSRRFFALPEALRRSVSVDKSPCMRGFAPIASQALDSDTPPDLKESFYVGIHMGPEHPSVRQGVPNYGPNQWPEGEDRFRSHTEAYFQAVCEVGRRVIRMLALSLQLEEAHFDRFFDEPLAVLRLLHYPPHPAGAPTAQMGAGAHTDWGAVTLLLQDDSGGLEVCNAAGEWILARPIPGTFVVNLGDMIPRWTNDLYVSTPHRVLNNRSGRDRYSAALFFNPAHFARIECLPTCVSNERPARYDPCTAGQHIAAMYRLTYGRANA